MELAKPMGPWPLNPPYEPYEPYEIEMRDFSSLDLTDHVAEIILFFDLHPEFGPASSGFRIKP